MGLDLCLKKGMEFSNTIQGGKVVLKNVFLGKKWKISFRHFSLYKFLISFVKLKWLEHRYINKHKCVQKVAKVGIF
jgi:hypothetical protein